MSLGIKIEKISRYLLIFLSYILLGGYMSKELFKKFVRIHPELGNHVMDNKTSWQKLYELYEMYGEDSDVWDKYIVRNVVTSTKNSESSFSDLINMIRNVDLESVQKGVSNLQKTIGLLQDIGIGSKSTTSTYEPRPLYRYFDD